jgi:hypothetical protein
MAADAQNSGDALARRPKLAAALAHDEAQVPSHRLSMRGRARAQVRAPGGNRSKPRLRLSSRFLSSDLRKLSVPRSPDGEYAPFQADAGARGGRAVVADQPAGEAGEDRRQGCAPRSLRSLPDDRGRGAERTVRAIPAADRRAATTAGLSVGSNGAYAQLQAWGIGAGYVSGAIEEAIGLGLVDAVRPGERRLSTYALTWLPLYDGTPASNRWKTYRNPDLRPPSVPKSKNLLHKQEAGLPPGPNLPHKRKANRPENLPHKRKDLLKRSYGAFCAASCGQLLGPRLRRSWCSAVPCC